MNAGDTPSPEIRIGTLSDFPENSRRLIQVQDKPILVINAAGTLYAFEDYCPHRGGPLSEGDFDSETVTCPWHGARFDFRSGKLLSGPCRTGLRSKTLRIATDGVFLH